MNYCTMECHSTFLVSSLLVLVLLGNTAESRSYLQRSGDSKIIGGRDAKTGEFPYQISLQVPDWVTGKFRHKCGGSIIDERHVLTAGHCVEKHHVGQLLVVAGVLNVTDTAHPSRVVRLVDQFYLHEEYDGSVLRNDIALIKVDRAFSFESSLIQPIPVRRDSLPPPAVCTVTGWGNTLQYPHNYPDILQSLDVPLVSQDVCVNSYKSWYLHILPGMMCAGYIQGGRDACGGDSGGPLMCNGQLTGIVSWGNNCALRNYPGVYTEVAQYKNWIVKTLATSINGRGLN